MTDQIPAEAVRAAMIAAIQSPDVPTGMRPDLVADDGVPVIRERVDLYQVAEVMLSAALPFLRPEPSESKADHDHRPVQHRDGREPWCKVCGLNPAYEEPRSRFARRPTPSREQVYSALWEATGIPGVPWEHAHDEDRYPVEVAADAVLALFKGAEG